MMLSSPLGCCGVTSSFAQLTGNSSSCLLPHRALRPPVNVHSMTKWQGVSVHVKLWCKLATKHWHCNICRGVVTVSIMISNTAISLPSLQLRETLRASTGRTWLHLILCVFFNKAICKTKETISEHEMAQRVKALPPSLWSEFHHQNPKSKRIDFHKLLSDLHTGALAHMEMRTHRQTG